MPFSHFGNCPATPRRLPRLLARHSKQPSVTILIPVKKCLRRSVEEKRKLASQNGTEELFKLELKCYVAVEVVDTYSSLSVELVKVDVGNNMLKYFLLFMTCTVQCFKINCRYKMNTDEDNS